MTDGKQDPDKGEVLSLWATLQAMTEMAKLAKEKEAPDE
jgi:heme-degrading monooxygenase HmoA